MRVATGSRVPIRIWASAIEEQAEAQLRNIAGLPFVFHHVAAMADAHLGIGATVGSVVATIGAVCPAAVGVDIGCGMIAQKTTLRFDSFGDSALSKLRASIERSIPVGPSEHRNPLEAGAAFIGAHSRPRAAPEKLVAKAARQIGTLGGGNHFIELCRDTDGFVWIILHSGSRNIGKSLAEIYIDRAKDLCDSFLDRLADRNLAHLEEGSTAFDDYIADLHWCQEYALANREAMMNLVVRDLSNFLGLSGAAPFLAGQMRVNCHHNYLARETHFGREVLVTRKGAIRARTGDLGIIPGSMGTGSFIVRGKGNPESFCSAPHGAGRRMSRGEARRSFSVGDLATQTSGVECRKDAGVLDEIPGAYKDIRTVMEDSSDLVEIVAELKQFLCVKG